MNNFLAYGNKTGSDDAPNYAVTSPVTTCQFLNNGGWDTDEAGLIAKTQNDEIDMLCRLDNFSGNAGNCLLFKAPADGIFRIVQKVKIGLAPKWFLVFVPLSTTVGDQAQINFQIGNFPAQLIVVGNAIVISNTAFTESSIGEIIIKGWVDYIMRECDKSTPSAGPLLGRTVRSAIFSKEELDRLKIDFPNRDARLIRAWNICTQRYATPHSPSWLEASIAIKKDQTLPIFPLLSTSQLTTLQLEIGFAEIPHSGSNYEYGNGWTWFDPKRIIKRLRFATPSPDDNSDATDPAWNIQIPESEVAGNAPIMAWHAHPPIASAEDNVVKITKLSNQQCIYFNPKQIQYLDSLNAVQKTQKDNDISRRISFFLANGLHDTQLSTNTPSIWSYRNGSETGERALSRGSFALVNDEDASLEINYELDNIQNLLQVKAVITGENASNSHIITSKIYATISVDTINRIKRAYYIPDDGFHVVDGHHHSKTLRLVADTFNELYLRLSIQSSISHIREAIQLLSNEPINEESYIPVNEIDISLVLALAIHECGGCELPLSVRSNRIVTAGRDAHTAGRSGLDNCYALRDHFPRSIRGEILRVKGNVGVPGNFVSNEREENTDPAYIKEEHLLIAFIIELRARKTRFIDVFNRFFESSTPQHGGRSFTLNEREILLQNLSLESKRAWIQASFGSPLGRLLDNIKLKIIHALNTGSTFNNILLDNQINLNAIIHNSTIDTTDLGRQRCRISAAEAALIDTFLPAF